jgi:hypothetical protein
MILSGLLGAPGRVKSRRISSGGPAEKEADKPTRVRYSIEDDDDVIE